MSEILDTIKQAALDAVEATKPADLMYGKVTGVSPLKILVEQRMELTAAQLVLSRNVTDYVVQMTVNHETGASLGAITHEHNCSGSTGTFSGNTNRYTGITDSGGDDDHTHGYAHDHSYSHNHDFSGNTGSHSVDLSHSHVYTGKKSFTVHNALSLGENVILLRKQGGQQFIVLDRIA